jgi:hypothetical protein
MANQTTNFYILLLLGALIASGCIANRGWGHHKPDRFIPFVLQSCDGERSVSGEMVINEGGIFRYVTEGDFREFPFDSLHGFQMSGGPSLFCWGGGALNSGTIISFETGPKTHRSPTSPYIQAISSSCKTDLYCVELEEYYKKDIPESEREKLHLEFSKSYGWVSMRSADHCYRLSEINGKAIAGNPRRIFKKWERY